MSLMLLMFLAASLVQVIHGFFQLLRRFFNITSCLVEKGPLAVYLSHIFNKGVPIFAIIC